MRREARRNDVWKGSDVFEKARLESHHPFLRVPCTPDIDRRKQTVLGVEAQIDVLRLLQ